MRKIFLLISPKNRTVYNFRGDLIRDIQKAGYDVIVTGPDFDGKEEIDKLGVQFHHVPLKKNGFSILSDLSYFVSLYKLIRREKPDLSLGYTIKPVIYGSLAARLAGVRNVNAMVTGAGYAFTAKGAKATLVRWLVSMLYRMGFAAANTVIFQNPDDCDEFVERGLLKSNKCRLVNGSGVNMQHFTPTSFPEQTTFFMLSRMLKSKGVREYLEAAALVKKKYPEVRFMLLGALEEMPDALKPEEVKAYIEDDVIDHFGETTDVRDYYKQCSVYVLPSYREGTPRTVLEAMAMGRPIITTDTNGCRETVEDGVNGFLVPVKDIQELADKMELFITNNNQITEMGAESFRICREKFDVNVINRNMINFLID